jgi:magnesium chelatase subunit I
MEAERTTFALDGVRSITPEYMKQVVAELTHLARASSDISQRSGVSVRVSIANYENLLSSALKRAIRLDENVAVPRVSDLGALAPSTGGKIEMETLGDGGEEKILLRLVQKAVLNVFNRSFGGAELAEVVKGFEGGVAVQTADSMPSEEYIKQVAQMPALRPPPSSAPPSRPAWRRGRVRPRGLHLTKKLNGTPRRAASATGSEPCRSFATRAGTAPRRSTSTPTTCCRRWPTISCTTAIRGAPCGG